MSKIFKSLKGTARLWDRDFLKFSKDLGLFPFHHQVICKNSQHDTPYLWVMTHKPPTCLSSVPHKNSIHSSCSFTHGETPSILPLLPVLKNLHLLSTAAQSCMLSCNWQCHSCHHLCNACFPGCTCFCRWHIPFLPKRSPYQTHHLAGQCALLHGVRWEFSTEWSQEPCCTTDRAHNIPCPRELAKQARKGKGMITSAP